MQRFFSSLAVIEQLTSSINHSGIRHICPICHKSDQWVSHGYLYKKPGDKAGKRVICGKRYGKSGCGHTQPLYLDDVVPQRRYRLTVLLAFVLSLLKGATVEQAYYQAIGHQHSSPRQAWRWINSLWDNMGRMRERLTSISFIGEPLRAGSRRLTILLNTVNQCLTQLARPEVIQLSAQHRLC